MDPALVIAAVFFAGAGGLVWFYFHRDMAELRGRLVGRSEVLQTAFGSIEYAQIGSGKPVLVIHGSGGGFDQSIEMAGQLAEYNCRLIAPSRFGYLRTDFPDNASPETQADAFAEFLHKLNLERVFVFGGSAGALSALQFAIRHHERCSGLILLVPAAFSPDRKPNETAAVGPLASSLIAAVLRSDLTFWLAVKFMPSTMIRWLLATEPAVIEAAGQDEQARAARILWHILPITERAKGLLLDTRTAGAPPRYDLERITCPVLAISAKDDLYGTAASAEYTAAQVSNGRLILYSTGGHLLAGRDREVWREIASFLDRL